MSLTNDTGSDQPLRLRPSGIHATPVTAGFHYTVECLGKIYGLKTITNSTTRSFREVNFDCLIKSLQQKFQIHCAVIQYKFMAFIQILKFYEF